MQKLNQRNILPMKTSWSTLPIKTAHSEKTHNRDRLEWMNDYHWSSEWIKVTGYHRPCTLKEQHNKIYLVVLQNSMDLFVLLCGMQFPRRDAIIKHDVIIRSTFYALRAGVQYRSLWQMRSRSSTQARVAYRILYLNGTDMKIELLPYILNFIPCAYEFGDGRYSELK